MTAHHPQVIDYNFIENQNRKTFSLSDWQGVILSSNSWSLNTQNEQLTKLIFSYNNELERINNFNLDFFNSVFSKLKSVIHELDFIKSSFDIIPSRQMSISLVFEENLLLILTKNINDNNHDLISMSIFKNKKLIFAGLTKIGSFVSKFHQYRS